MTTRTPASLPLDDQPEALIRRMRLPHMRRTAPEVLATAKAQRFLSRRSSVGVTTVGHDVVSYNFHGSC